MLGKFFWGMVILLFIAILVIPFILPSYYANQAEEQYYSENYEGDDGEIDGGDDFDIDFKKRHKRTSSTKSSFAKSVRSSGGSRSFSSGK